MDGSLNPLVKGRKKIRLTPWRLRFDWPTVRKRRGERREEEKKKQNKQTNRWDVAPVENDHWQNFYNARAARGEANERERTIRTYPIRDRPTDVRVSIVFLLHVPFSLLFLAELPRTCLDWHRRGGELPCRAFCPPRCHCTVYIDRSSVSCPRQLDIPWTGCRYEQR